MDHKKKNRHGEYEPWDPEIYRTGSTESQKSYRGIIALLLVAVIILCGAVSILGVMNIRLFRQLQSDSATHPFRFDSTTPAMHTPQNTPSLAADESLASEPALLDEIGLTEGKDFDALGVNGETVPSFYQSYYRIPHGLHIADITPEGAADTAGLQEGDILLSLNGTPITDTEALHALINSFQPGDTVVASVYRNGQQYNITITFTVAETEGAEVTE